MKTKRITGRYDPAALRAVLRSQPKISCAPGEGLDILLATPVALYALTPSEYKDAVFPLVKTDPGAWTRLRSGEMKQDAVPYSALSILRDAASKTADEPVLEKGPLRLACGKTLLRPFHHPKNGFIVWINDALVSPLADAGIELRGAGPKMPVTAFDRGRPTAVLMPSVVSGPANDGAKAFYDTRRLENEMAAKSWGEVKRDGPIWD